MQGQLFCADVASYCCCSEQTSFAVYTQVQYQVDDASASGTCGTCIHASDRSLVANLAAANNYKVRTGSTPTASRSCAVLAALQQKAGSFRLLLLFHVVNLDGV